MLNRRPYEVSIWTLQDDFITVLKPSTVENKGQLQDEPLIIKTDGTQEFSFSIPMYLFEGKELMENPLWYNVTDGNLIANMRKIKVIFNKKSAQEKVFEFLITKVIERHEKDEIYCDVTCEGLAFNELGKVGYKISLSSEDYELEREEWEDSGRQGEEPVADIHYWAKKIGLIPYPTTTNAVIKANTWYYKVRMHWGQNGNIEEDTVYEEPYVSSWDVNASNRIEAVTIESRKEKQRMINETESNKYNLTQKIAETFGVFCRYEYGYDENYHIISRVITFYNNFFQEGAAENHVDINYPYNTDQVTREIDSADVTTKMFVRDPSDNGADYETSILDSPANETLEDYLLNFDYLYKSGAIGKNLYDLVPQYKADIRKLNVQIRRYQQTIERLERRKQYLTPKLSVAESKLKNAVKLIEESDQFINNLTNNTGIIELTENNPQLLTVVNSSDETVDPYVKLTTKGIDPGSIKLFKTYNSMSNPKLSGPLYKLKRTMENGFLVQVALDRTEATDSETHTIVNAVYATYKYTPYGYWSTIKEIYIKIQQQAQREINNYTAWISGVENNINDAQIGLTNALNNKKAVMDRFERQMGPSLREGYWQPEDYTDYGTIIKQSKTQVTSFDKIDKCPYWDSELFEDEQDIYYEEGVQQDQIYYPVFDLSNVSFTDIDKLAFIYYEPTYLLNLYLKVQDFNYAGYDSLTDTQKAEIQHIKDQRVAYIKYCAVGSQAEVMYVRQRDNINSPYNIKPVLVITDTSIFDTDNRDYFTTGVYENTSIYEPQPNFPNIYAWLIGHGYWRDEPFKQFTAGVGVLSNYQDSTYVSGNTTITTQMVPLINNGVSGGSTYWITKNPSFNPSFESSTYWLKKNTNLQAVYPRIYINSEKLKVSSTTLGIYWYPSQNSNPATELKQFTDYYILSSVQDNVSSSSINSIYYTITIRPQSVMKSKTSLYFSYFYTVSTADTAIYLDAIKILKENSQPKVSYEVSVTVFPNYTDTVNKPLYDMLACIVHINDALLKFDNVRGYISELSLNLSKPEEDKITIKNYNNKFEDLFSSIVAQTQQMAKNENIISTIPSLTAKIEQLTKQVNDVVPEPTGTGEVVKYGDILEAYLDAHFDSRAVVQSALIEVLNDSSIVFKDVTQAISEINDSLPEIEQALTNFGTANLNGTSLASKIRKGVTSSFKNTGVHIDQENGTVQIRAADANATHSLIDLSRTGINILTQDLDSSFTGITMGTYNAQDSITTGVQLDSTGLLLGAGNSAVTSAVSIKPEAILLGQGSTAQPLTNISNGGLEIQKDKIDLWVQTNTNNQTKITREILNSSGLLLGVYYSENGTAQNGTVVQIKENAIIMGNQKNNGQGAADTAGYDSSGLKLTNNSFNLITGASGNYSSISMNADGLCLAAGNISGRSESQVSGTYASLSKNGLILGSMANLNVNTNNFKLQTNAGASGLGTTVFAIGTNLNNINSSTAINDSTLRSNVQLLVNQNGLYINGQGTFSGEVHATAFYLNGSNTPVSTTPDGQIATVPMDGLSQTFTANDKCTYGVAVTAATGMVFQTGGVSGGGTSGLTLLSAANQQTIQSQQVTAFSGLHADRNSFCLFFGYNQDRISGTVTPESVYAKSAIVGIPTIDYSRPAKYVVTRDCRGIRQLSGAFYMDSTGIDIIGSQKHLFIDDASGSVNYPTGADATAMQNYTSVNHVYIFPNQIQLAAEGSEIILGKTGINLTASNNSVSIASNAISLSASGNTLEIKPNAIDLTINQNNFIKMSSSGLQVKGSKIQMSDANGVLKDIWGRDDIIIMNPNATGDDAWRANVSSIENQMSGKTDWVLIKPGYDATIHYVSTTTTNRTQGSLVTVGQSTRESDVAFGSGASWYRYTVSFQARYGFNTDTSTTSLDVGNVSIQLSTNSTNVKTVYVNQYTGISQGSSNVSVTGLLPKIVHTREGWTSYQFVLESSGSNTVNLCGDDDSSITAQIGMYIDGSKSVEFRNFSLEATTAATTSRVPCTIYYYP